MEVRFHSWWQTMKRHPFIIAGIIVAIFAFTFAVYTFGWDWTGFNGGYSTITTTSINHGTATATQKPLRKTLWDLLQLLIVPAVLSLFGLWFTRTQQLRDREHEKLQHERDQEAANIQYNRDQRLADQHAQTEREAAEKRTQTEYEVAKDNQRETALQGYIDKMSELLLHENLRESDPKEEVRKIARVRTLTVLPRLDSERKRRVLQFLYESGLIDKDKSIVDLHEADLQGAELEDASLDGADLSGADLSFANMDGADLRRASLSIALLYKAFLDGAFLDGAFLREADLREASLREAHLTSADLSGADLSGADLSGADLSGADLKGTTGITIEELETTAKSLRGTTMPDGSKHS
jgi:uncharacterized protein YjbI with pentapeptide repeats